MAEKEKKVKKVKAQVIAKKGNVYISASFNNTLVTVTDEAGNTLGWASSGAAGFKGTKKSTPFAATTAVERVVKKAKEVNGVAEVDIFIKGPGAGRDASLRAIRSTGVKINKIADVTPIPHNGPRPKKKRRV